jgi:hypothetical protein
MNDKASPDAGTADTGGTGAAVIPTPAAAETVDAAAAAAAAAAATAAITQTTESAAAVAHVQTARDSYAGGVSLADCVAWLQSQGHDAYKEAAAAEAAISQ